MEQNHDISFIKNFSKKDHNNELLPVPEEDKPEIKTFQYLKLCNRIHNIKLQNINSLIESIRLIIEYTKNTHYKVFYRGNAQPITENLPGIYRMGANVIKEHEMIYELYRACPDSFNNCHNSFEHLEMMQHYGLRTRILDITENPLVATYFATTNYNKPSNDDGEVVVYFVEEDNIHHFDDEIVSVLSNLAFIKAAPDFKSLKPKLLQRVKQEIFDISFIKESTLNQTVCVVPRLNNPRIIRQSGAFFLYGIREGNKIQYCPLKFKSLKIIIPKHLKANLRMMVEAFGINKSVLFPEIESYSQHLTELYRSV